MEEWRQEEAGFTEMGCSDEASAAEKNEGACPRTARTALQQGLHYLSHRCLSVWEMERRLERAFYPQEERRQAIAKLQEWGYLDDREFASAYCRTKKERFSRKKIAYELTRRGVSRDCIENALTDEYGEEEELEVCRNRMLKAWELVCDQGELFSKSERWKLLESFKARFARKGFPCASVQRIVDEEPRCFFPTNAREA